MAAQSDGQDLTGVWNGLYSYPDGLSVTFVATLIESGGVLTGSTHEPCVRGAAAGVTLYASLAGRRRDSMVSFHKTYDGTVPEYRTVDYVGTLNAEATEIEGRWIIPGVWSGKFMMIRPSRTEASAEREVTERAS
jgi:hypothetical protein